MPVSTKLGSMVTYIKVLLPIKLFEPLVSWSCKTTWQIKIVESTLPRCQWAPFSRMVTYLECLPPQKVTWRFDDMKKENHYISTITIPKVTRLARVMTCNDKVTKDFNHMVLWDHLTNSVLYISFCTRTMTSKLGKEPTEREGISPKISQNILNICSREVIWPIKNIPPSEYLWSPNLSVWRNTVSKCCKCTWPLKEVFLWDHVTN